ncbi:hypothetical protein [Acinetobacter sp. WZC-1]|uniref:hypothetical protein n=1 Tax=Acinetobacter sp. WZC-1 TaxID=3459034 RepID=UPI00403D98E8
MNLLVSGSLHAMQSPPAAPTVVESGIFDCLNTGENVEQPATIVYFLNGISTTDIQAQTGAIGIFNRLKEESLFKDMVDQQQVRMKTLYNPTDPVFGDYIELFVENSIQQTATDATNRLMEEPEYKDLTGTARETVRQAIYDEQLDQAYHTYWARSFGQLSFLVSDGQRLISQYLMLANEVASTLLAGNKVVIVAHSQGNYVVQGIAAFLTQQSVLSDLLKSSLRVVGVANVAATTPNDRYTTIDQDKAVFFLHKDLQGGHPMEGNFDAVFANGEDLSGWWPWPSQAQQQTDINNHGIIDTYMSARFDDKAEFIPHDPTIVARDKRDFPLYRKITGQVMDSLREIRWPKKVTSQGVISSTLTWFGDSNLNLQVNEPKAKVDEDAPSGVLGKLDLHNNNGTGAEYYGVTCSSLNTLISDKNQSLDFSIEAPQRSSVSQNATLGLKIGSYPLVQRGDLKANDDQSLGKRYQLDLSLSERTRDKSKYQFTLTEF